MMLAAKHFDPVLGVDIHLIQPPGPVPPVPIPHPFVGFLIDPMDYLPIIGSTVLVNGVHRAQAGTAGKCVPPHIPIGGTFIKPPGNECEMFMGSATVEVDGDAFSYLALPALSCQCIGMPPPPRLKKKSQAKSLLLPTSVVLPIPAGPPVLVGGPPTISLMVLGMKAAMAGLGKAFKKLNKTKLAKRASQGFKKAKQKACQNLKPGLLKCKVLRAEPVDITTGEVVVDQQDFSIPGRIPLEFNRHYSSHSNYRGVCGYGWQTQADARLERDEDGVIGFYEGGSGAVFFESLPGEEPVLEPLDGGLLDAAGGKLVVRLKSGLSYEFPEFEEEKTVVHAECVRDLCGNELRFIRNAAGLKEIRESAGRSIEVTSEKGRIQSMQFRHPDDPNPFPLVRLEYDAHGNLAAVYDASGVALRFVYHRHRLIRHTDRNGLSFHYEYARHGAVLRCVRSRGDQGLYDYRFEYDDLLAETRVTDSLGNVTVVVLDDRQLPLRETDALGGVTQFEYDEVGRTTAVVDPLQRRTELVHDDRGNLVQLTRRDGTNILVEYDARNAPAAIVDPKGNLWRHQWDHRKLLVSRTSPEGADWQYRYSECGDLVSAVNPRGAETTVVRDRFGDVVAVVDPLNQRHSFAHDAFGNVIAVTDPSGATTQLQYDGSGRLVATQHPGGSTSHAARDNMGNVIELTDERGNRFRYEYTGLGQIAARKLPGGKTVRYEYDTEEQLVGIVHPSGRVYRLERDALGRIVREIDYWGGERRVAFDAAGNVIGTNRSGGCEATFDRDAMGRIVARSEHGRETHRFAYDASGNCVLAASGDCSMQRFFNADGQLVREIQNGVQIDYAYDAAGNRVARHTSYGNTVQYAYDLCDQLIGLDINGVSASRITRDPCGWVSREALGACVERRSEYDAQGWVTRQSVTSPAGETVFEYRYDAAHNLLERTSPDGRDELAYDAEGRLIRYAAASGKLFEIPVPPAEALHFPSETSSPDARREGSVLGVRHRYDDLGNLVERQHDQQDSSFHWDGNDQLVRVVTAEGRETEMQYDALGRRVAKATGTTTRRFSWDEDTLLAEEDGADGVHEYVFYPGTFVPLAIIDQEKRVSFFHTDPAGVPRQVTDAGGEVLWSASYGPFGDIDQVTADRIENPLRLQGQYYDPEFGLSYNRARYYDPLIGVFVTPDPLGLSAGEDVYQYALNVWGWIDPLGLTCTQLGLGLKHPKSGLDYQKWAHNKGYKTYADLGGRGTFDEQIRRSMNSVDEIHFNLKGVETQHIGPKHGRLNEYGEPMNGYTNYELYLIRTNPDYRKKAIFHDEGGNIMPKGWTPWD